MADQVHRAPHDPEGIRAEELIAGVYAQIRQARERGREVTGVVLPLAFYHVIQQYRARLGETKGELPDYLSRYELFGVPIYTDNGTTIVIKTKS